MAGKKRSSEEYIVLSISGAMTVAILPFCFVRLLAAEWAMASLDVFAVAILAGAFLHVYLTGKTVVANYIIAVFSLLICFTSVYIKDSAQLFWVYPALVLTFFLLPPRQAAVATSGLLILLIPVVFYKVDLLIAATFYLTIITNNIAVYVFAHRMREQQARLSALAIKDPLTDAGNRRALEEKLLEVVAMQDRFDSEVSMILLDLDNFKKINDRYGHNEGDKVLIQVASVVAQRIRSTDSLFRFGGEEFVVIAENTNVQNIVNLAEELRTAVEACNVLRKHSVSISLGCAQFHPDETGYEWLGRADKAMFQAKREGRNLSRVA